MLAIASILATGSLAQPALGQDQATDPSQKNASEQIWEGILNAGLQKLRLEFHLSKTGNDGAVSGNLVSVDQGNAKIPINSGMIQDGKMNLKIDAIAGGFSGTLNADATACTGHWSQGPAKFPLTIKLRAPGSAPLEKKDAKTWANRPQRPQAPIPYRSTEVTIEHAPAGVTLAGTLTLPEGPVKASVILVSGSGPQDRDETLMEHKPFLVIADHLTRKGIAVLRYDDRGFGKSTGDFGSATTADFAKDALAAINFLTQQDSLKDHPIGIIGHSEGGLIGPMVANDSEAVNFVVLLAGPGVDGIKVVESQGRAIAKRMGATAQQLARNSELNEKLFAILRNAKPTDDLKPQVRAAFDEWVESMPEAMQENAKAQLASVMPLATPWFRFFATYDPIPALRNMKVPTLALLGEKDLQILPSANEGPLRTALEANGIEGNEVLVFPKLNHLFQESVTGLPAEYQTIDETVNEAVLKKISDWILERT